MPELLIVDRAAFDVLPNLTTVLMNYNPKLARIDPLAFNSSGETPPIETVDST